MPEVEICKEKQCLIKNTGLTKGHFVLISFENPLGIGILQEPGKQEMSLKGLFQFFDS